MSQPTISEFDATKQLETLADEYFDPRTFCRLRFSPMLATGVIISMLREHFGNPSSIVDPMLQRCVWRNDNATGMLIEASTNDSILTNIQQRPAILVRRNAMKTQRLGIGDKVFQMGPHRGESFVIAIHGSHTIFNIATRAGHAESLANETSMFLMKFAPALRGSLCFTGDFQFEELGQVGKLDGIGGQYVVPATFSYITEIPWTLNENVPPIRHIHFRMLLDP
jgi:hypothetical protein